MPAGPFPYHAATPNTIKLIVENRCDAPWALYVETLLPATGAAVLSILSFGMDDVVRGAFRPRAKRSARHRRRGKKGRKFNFRIPELGNMMGSTIMVDKAFPIREVHKGVKHLWIVDGITQRALWWWLVYDVVDEFHYEWSSLIMQSEFCQDKLAQRLFAQGTGGGLLGILSWQALLCPTITYITSGMTWNVSTGRVPAGKFMIIAYVFAINTGTKDQTVKLGIFHDALFTDPIDISEPEFIEVGFSAKLIAAGPLEGPARYTVGWRNDRGGTSGFVSGVFAMQIGF